jgi:hypothetical protein
MYVPVPIGIRVARAEHDVEQLAAEIFALSKMNWNQSQLDGRLPTTLRAAAWGRQRAQTRSPVLQLPLGMRTTCDTLHGALTWVSGHRATLQGSRQVRSADAERAFSFGCRPEGPAKGGVSRD